MAESNLGSAGALACWFRRLAETIFANPRRLRPHARRARYPDRSVHWRLKERRFAPANLNQRRFQTAAPWVQRKMPAPKAFGAGIVSYLQQRLNCALPFQSSSSLGFFRFQGLNGITEPRIASGSILAVDLFNPERIRGEFSLERR
jgi:hypothetical protein